MFNFNPADLLFRLPAVVISLTVHEFFHAYSAYLLGDSTARNLGRLTLNPARHLDPIGFICLTFFRFGWAKPVPVNPYNFRSLDVKTGMMLTALAGPASNILLCFLSVGIWSFLNASRMSPSSWLAGFLLYMCFINASLAFFNLIPVPPLDGSKILFGVLPDRLYDIAQSMEQFGFVLLMVVIMSRIPELIIGPLSTGLINGFARFYGLFL